MRKRTKNTGTIGEIRLEWVMSAMTMEPIDQLLEIDGVSFGRVAIDFRLLAQAIESAVHTHVLVRLAQERRFSDQQLASWKVSVAKASQLLLRPGGLAARIAVAELHDVLVSPIWRVLSYIEECSNPQCGKAYVPMLDRRKLTKARRRPTMYCSPKCQQTRWRSRTEDAARWRKRQRAATQEILSISNASRLENLILRSEQKPAILKLLKTNPRAKKILAELQARRKAKRQRSA